MRNITYKYNVGDIVALKPNHYYEAEINGTKVLVTAAEIVERKDYNGPCYALGGSGCFWKEACFAGLAMELKNRLYSYEGAEVYTDLPTELSCDTESSGESEKDLKWNEAKWVEALFQRGEYYCSRCGGFALHKSDGTENPTPFCPHCGKTMINFEEARNGN
jgi:hypothetical protein